MTWKLDNSLFDKLKMIFKNPKVYGVNLYFKNVNKFISNLPKGLIEIQINLKKLLDYFRPSNCK